VWCPPTQDGPPGLGAPEHPRRTNLTIASPRSADTQPEVASATRKDAAVPPPHPAEFRRAVELARERATPIAELAKDLRISESCLRNWLTQADADERGSETRLTSGEKKSSRS
jgi:hypothetical protein